MTPTEYRVAIAQLGMSQRRAAKFFEAAPATGPRWAKHGPTPPVAMKLRLMIAMELTPDNVEGWLERGGSKQAWWTLPGAEERL